MATSGVRFRALPTSARARKNPGMDEWGMERPEHTTEFSERKGCCSREITRWATGARCHRCAPSGVRRLALTRIVLLSTIPTFSEGVPGDVQDLAMLRSNILQTRRA